MSNQNRCNAVLWVRPAGILSHRALGCCGAAAFLLSALPGAARAQQVEVFQTNADQSALLTPQPPLDLQPGLDSPLAIHVDDGIRHQQMDGFGASLTDSSAWLIGTQLPRAERDAVMQRLFGAQGIRLSFLRQPMGASDFATSNYSYDEVPAGQTDEEMCRFSIEHDEAYVIPLLQRALALNPRLTVMAVPWSPPSWMKTNGSLRGGGVKAEYENALAAYFVELVESYDAHGIPIHYVAAQNEPLFAGWGYPDEEQHAYASAFMTAGQQARFIGQHLGPAFARARIGTRILGFEHNWDNILYPLSLLQDSRASRYLAGVSFHCYAGDRELAQNAVQQLFPNKGIWFTECTGVTSFPVFGDNLGWNMRNLFMGAVRQGARSVSLWNMALDQNNGPTTTGEGCTNCRGVVTVDTSTSPPSLRYEVEYYSIGHFSKVVEPGAYRIESNVAGPIDNVAFQNPDGSIALVAHNSSASESAFNVRWNDRVFSTKLPAGAVASFKWNAAPGRGFDVAVESASRVLSQGAAAELGIVVPRYGGFERRVSLDVAGLPVGVSVARTERDQLRQIARDWWEQGSAFRDHFRRGPGDPFSNRRDVRADEHVLRFTASESAAVGNHPITVSAKNGNTSHAATFQLVVGPRQAPFGTSGARLVPGRIEAEDFDTGGPGVAYYDRDSSNNGGASYRAEGVDIEGTTDEGGGYNLSYTAPGEWLKYSIDVEQAGLYNVAARVAAAQNGGFFHVEVDGKNVTGSMRVPNTWWWQNWTTVSSPSFALSPGPHELRLVFDGNGEPGNLNWLEVNHAVAGVPFDGIPAAIPGVIEVEDFDLGGDGVGYWDVDSWNSGGQYRADEGPDIESCGDVGGGFDIGWSQVGEWLAYTVDIAETRRYLLKVRAASPVPGGAFHIAVDGKKVTGSIALPSTDAWQTYTTIEVPHVLLPAGEHRLELVLENDGYWGGVGNLNWLSFE